MKRFKKQIPNGVQDYLPAECYNKWLTEERIRRCFYYAGYDEIQTPTFEYYDVFASGVGSIRQEKMLKFIDQNGCILVLRPDMTMPIARAASTRALPLPARLFYIAPVFGYDGSFYSSQKEFTQAGVELLGVSGPEADAEVIALAVEAMKAAGLKNFQIDIGQVEFFKGLMEEAGLSGEDSEQLRDYVDQKNDLAAELFLRRRNIPPEVTRRIAKMSALYGGPEVFDAAEGFSDHPRCRAAVENLRTVYRILEKFGVADCIFVDFGMLQSLEYYSGLIFRGISGDIGHPLLSGGRYDRLLGEFSETGESIPATGFALGIKRTMIALERQGSLEKLPPVEYVVSGDKSAAALVYERIRALRARGSRVECALHLEREELVRYAVKKGAAPLYVEGEK